MTNSVTPIVFIQSFTFATQAWTMPPLDVVVNASVAPVMQPTYGRHVGFARVCMWWFPSGPPTSCWNNIGGMYGSRYTDRRHQRRLRRPRQEPLVLDATVSPPARSLPPYHHHQQQQQQQQHVLVVVVVVVIPSPPRTVLLVILLLLR